MLDKNRVMNLTAMIGLIAVTASLLGCTRDNGKSSDFSVNISSMTNPVSRNAGSQRNTLSLSYIQHIVINVRDSSGRLAMTPIAWDADCNCYPKTYASAPASFNLTVPNGSSNMLVQVVVAGSNVSQSSGVSVVRYGDSPVDMSGGQNQSVTITEADLGTGNGTQGNLVGRFVDVGGAGRTGRMIMQVVPPAGKPPVDLQVKDIVGGWFNIGMADGIPFRYIFEDGTPIFNSLMLSSGALSVNGALASGTHSLVGLSVPSYWQNQGSGNCSVQNPQINYFGFFGDPTYVSTANIIYPSVNTAQSSQYTSQSTCSTSLSSGLLNFVPTSATGSDIGRVGGVGGLTTGAGVNYQDQLTLVGTNLGNNSGSGFQGAYRSTNGQALTVSYTSGGNYLTANWAYINAAAFAGPTPLAGTEIFYKKYPAGDSSFYQVSNNDGPLCDLLPSMGFKSAGSASGFAQTSLVIPSIAATDAVGVIACAYQSNLFGIVKRYMRSTANTGFQIGYNAPGTSLPVATQIVLSLVGNGSNAVVNACIPVHVATRTSMGAVAALSSASWSMSGPFQPFSDVNCTTSLNISKLPAAMNDTLYFRSTSSTGAANLSLFGSGGLTGAMNLTAQSTAGSANGAAIWLEKNNPIITECLAGSITLQNTVGPTAVSSNGTSFPITLTGSSTSAYAWSDTTCQSPITTFSIPAGQTSVPFRYKALNGSASGFNAAAAGLTFDYTHSTLIPTFSGSPVQLALLTGFTGTSNLLAAGACVPMNIQSMDSNFLPSIVASAQSITVASNDAGMHFYTDSTCVTPLSGAVVIASGSALAPPIYVQTPTLGPLTISASNGTSLFANANFQSSQLNFSLDLSSLFHITGNYYLIPFQGATTADCTLVTADLELAGAPYNAHGNAISFNISNGTYNLYSDPGCGTSISPSGGGNIPAGSAYGAFYVRPSTLNSSQAAFSITDPAALIVQSLYSNISSEVIIDAVYTGTSLSTTPLQCGAPTIQLTYRDKFTTPLTSLVGLPNSGIISYNLGTSLGGSWTYKFFNSGSSCTSNTTGNLTSDSTAMLNPFYYITKNGAGSSGTGNVVITPTAPSNMYVISGAVATFPFTSF